MNNPSYTATKSAIAVAVAASLFIGCASTPKHPAGYEQVRTKLTALQNDPKLANGAPVALKDAEAAVHAAEPAEKNLVLAAHRVYMADHKVETARSLAETKVAELERTALNEQSEKARLNARTLEADRAKSEALVARAETAEQRLAANASQQVANDAQAQAAELQRQLEILQARPTDRGLVLTLGDTLFATGKAELKAGATANLNRLTKFMNEYPNRTAAIEGFTDSMGSDEMNQSLSERRAAAVKDYLVGQGVGSARLSSKGRGENSPVADNDSVAGRQQNRRVEVIIDQPSN
jgi:outer membrane protein OmpA-like peptidoglycan-associated protein